MQCYLPLTHPTSCHIMSHALQQLIHADALVLLHQSSAFFLLRLLAQQCPHTHLHRCGAQVTPITIPGITNLAPQMHSGTCLPEAYYWGNKLKKQLGCGKAADVRQCLMSKTAQQVLAAQLDINPDAVNTFTPAVDGVEWPQSPLKLMKQGGCSWQNCFCVFSTGGGEFWDHVHGWHAITCL